MLRRERNYRQLAIRWERSYEHLWGQLRIQGDGHLVRSAAEVHSACLGFLLTFTTQGGGSYRRRNTFKICIHWLFTPKSRRGEISYFGKRNLCLRGSRRGSWAQPPFLWRVSQMPSAFTVAKRPQCPSSLPPNTYTSWWIVKTNKNKYSNRVKAGNKALCVVAPLTKQ